MGRRRVGGPLFDDPKTQKLTGALWIVQGEGADAVRKLVGSDAFAAQGTLAITSVRAFMAAGGSRIAPAEAAPGGR